VLTAAALGAPATVRAAQCTGGTPTACGGVTAVTYNGAALTKLGVASNGTVQAEIWYIKAPSTGTNNIVITAPFPTDIMASAVSFTGVDQTTPFKTGTGAFTTAFGTSATASRTITSGAAGDPIFDIMGANTNATPTVTNATTAGQTLRNTATGGVRTVAMGQSTAYGKTTSTNMSWTLGSSVDWAIAAVAIKASTTLTGVDVGSFTAQWGDGGTRLDWRTGYQPTTVGFYVHRREGNNPRSRLNTELIQGGALEGGAGVFSWTDSTPGWNGPVSYWLEEVDRNGTSKWYGPASPVPPEAPAVTPPATPDGGAAAPDALAPIGGFTGVAGAHGGGATPGYELQNGCVIGSRAPNLDAARMLVLLGVGISARRRKGRHGWILPVLLIALLGATTFVGQREAGAAGGVAVDATSTGEGANGLTFSHTMGTAANGLLMVGIVVPIECVTTTTNAGSCSACGTTCGIDTTATPALSTGLVGHWRFDEGSGSTSTDVSGNNNTAGLFNSPSWTNGYSSYAVRFDGATNYAQAPLGSTSFATSATVTAAAWVYVTANTNGPIFGVANTPVGGTYSTPFLSMDGNGTTVKLWGYIWNNTAFSYTVPTASLNAWHHVAITYDPAGGGTTTRLYFDGTQVGTAGGTLTAASTNVYWTTYVSGTKPTGVNSYLLGRIDDVRAYNKVLSAAQLTTLAGARKTCAASACAACASGTLCSGNCVATATDEFNCGSCGTVCNVAGGQSCTASACACSGGQTNCSTFCSTTSTDASNCGGCGTVCNNDTPAFIDSSLVGRWKMNEGTGATTADASGNARTATLTNTPTWSAGYSGYGLTFDGVSEYLNAPLGTSFGGNNTLTASAWVYATSATNGPIFGVTDTAPGGGWNMPFLSINGATVYGHIWMVNSNVPLSATVTLNAWHHLAITYDPTLASNNEKFYVDGALSSQGTGTFSPSGVTTYWTTYIPGAKPTNVNSLLTGLIDDVRGWNRALSATEIAVVYNARRSCAASTCSTTCPTGEFMCSGTCTNRTIDTNNCGACGTVCNTAGGQVCTGSSCVCSSGTLCSGSCYDTTTDASHCGNCVTACGSVTVPSVDYGLLGYWPMNNGSGTTLTDASTNPANGNNATLTGSPTWLPTGGYNSTATVTFNGTSQYPTASLGTWFGNNNTMSATAWVYATSTTNGSIFGVTNGTGASGTWLMPFLSIDGATVYGWIWNVNGNTPLSSTVTLNNWHHVAITYDPSGSGTERFYVDGVLKGTGTGTFQGAGSAVYWQTYIWGAKPSGVGDYLNGKIDEVRAYKRVLTAGEVSLMYNARKTCSASVCSSSCPTGTTACGATCTNTLADKNNCNACGTVCSGGTPYCVSGACSATP
jgi:hypothetical protein